MPIIEKTTKNHYRVAVVDMHSVAAQKIFQEHGDTVTVVDIFKDSDDPTFYIIEIQDS